jgi:hypothetical protein
MIRFVLHAMNVILILSMIGCIAGALAGLILLLPFVAGAWGLNLTALVAYEHNWGPDAAKQPQREAAAANVAAAPALAVTEPSASGE